MTKPVQDLIVYTKVLCKFPRKWYSLTHQSLAPLESSSAQGILLILSNGICTISIVQKLVGCRVDLKEYTSLTSSTLNLHSVSMSEWKAASLFLFVCFLPLKNTLSISPETYHSGNLVGCSDLITKSSILLTTQGNCYCQKWKYNWSFYFWDLSVPKIWAFSLML